MVPQMDLQLSPLSRSIYHDLAEKERDAALGPRFEIRCIQKVLQDPKYLIPYTWGIMVPCYIKVMQGC